MRISSSSAQSNTGRKRRHNEDSYVASPPVFAVADGMGGAQAGEVASGLAAETVLESELDPAASGEERVVSLIKAANLRVHERARIDATASGMGTTMTMAMLQADGTVAIGHVGDSRAYRLRGDTLEQLTDDHSLVAELVRRGELSLAEAAVHPQRSVITRALGTEADIDVDAFTVDALDGDVFLLCSDGLTTMVDVDTISRILQRYRSSLDEAAAALIKAANDRGGDDNITAILFAVADGDPEATVELPPALLEPDPDDEDTLHPEDRVMLPPELRDSDVLDLPTVDAELQQAELQQAELLGAGAPPADVTMVVSPEEIQRALAASAAPASAPVEPSLPPLEPEPAHRPSLGRLAVATVVIAALVAAIVLLVLDALPR